MRYECTLSLSTEPLPGPPTGDDYRRLAEQIRDAARQTRLPVARRELLRLATNYDRRGDHLDRRTCYFAAQAASATPSAERTRLTGDRVGLIWIHHPVASTSKPS
jgi:hypothetical protein